MFTASTGAFVLAVLKALPALIQLISSIKTQADAKANQGIGFDQAVADMLRTASDRVNTANQVEAEAAKDHAAKPDDTAFDNEFRRP